jgi:hypothetical protein
MTKRVWILDAWNMFFIEGTSLLLLRPTLYASRFTRRMSIIHCMFRLQRSVSLRYQTRFRVPIHDAHCSVCSVGAISFAACVWAEYY